MSLTRRMHIVQSDEQKTLMDISLKVAFASSDMKTVNQHFGSAKSFAIYAVNPDQAQFVEAAEFGVQKQDGNEDKLLAKFDLIHDCVAVYCQAAGASAVKQLVARGIQPVKVQENSPIEGLVADLQAELKSGPSKWLARAIKQQTAGDNSRFDDMAEEEWDE